MESLAEGVSPTESLSMPTPRIGRGLPSIGCSLFRVSRARLRPGAAPGAYSGDVLFKRSDDSATTTTAQDELSVTESKRLPAPKGRPTPTRKSRGSP